MACQICGKYSGFYPLCDEHFKERDKGLILKCDECGIWHKFEDKCKCKPQQCIICNKTQNKLICSECVKLTSIEQNQLHNIFNLNELNNLYYQTKYNALSIENEESFKTSLIKLNAISIVYVQEQEDYTLKNAFINDVKYLKEKRLEKLQKNPDNESNDDNLDSIENDYRKNYPAIYRCTDGHYVRSKSEREIDNFLYEQKIWHEYEKEEYDPSTKETYYTDFYLPEFNLSIEHFGVDTPRYKRKCERKIEFFKRNNLMYIITTEKEANILNDFLKKQLKNIEFENKITILNKR